MSEDQIQRILEAIARLETKVDNHTTRAIEDREEVDKHRNEMTKHIEGHETRIRANENKISKWSIPIAILIAIISSFSVSALNTEDASTKELVQEVIAEQLNKDQGEE